jgi:hypothetical protein
LSREWGLEQVSQGSIPQKPPVYTLPEFIALCEKLLPYWNQKRYSQPEPPLPPGEPFRFKDEELRK